LLAIAAPAISLVCLIFGTAHQIKLLLEQGTSKELSLPRIFLGIFAGIIWILYGRQINNICIIFTNSVGIVINVILALVIMHLRK